MTSKIGKWTIAKKAWAPLMGVLVVGGLCYSLRLEGASGPGQRGEQDRAVSGGNAAAIPTVSASGTSRRVSFGKIPKSEYPIAPPVLVDPFNDEGNAYRQRTGATGPIPLPQINGGTIAAVACSFAVDCDDGNPCTYDLCDMAQGGAALSGTCHNDPVGNESAVIDELLGDCDDGVFCNGAERCAGAAIFHCLGTCTGGPNNGLPCATDQANLNNCPLGSCNTRKCVGGPNNNAACVYDSECTTVLGTCSNPGNPCSGGTPLCNEITDGCQAACASDAQCADPTTTAATDACTLDYCCLAGSYTRKTCVGGAKIGSLCDGTNSNQCTGSTCGNPVSVPCDVNGTCVRGNPCGPAAACINRFCVGGGPTFNLQPCVTNNDCGNPGPTQGVCTDATLCAGGRCCTTGSCERRNFGPCAPGPLGGKKWFAGDTGRVDGSGTTCPPTANCPKYGAGIGELGLFTVVAGPTTISPFANLMSGMPLRKLGDDYDFTGTAALITITDLRFVGGVDNVTNSRTSFEFYDQSGTFVEDIFFITLTNTIAVQNVQFDVNNTPFDIPGKGYIVAHVLQSFAGDIVSLGEFFWLATDAADHGVNDAANLFVDTDLAGAPVVIPNFLKACVGGVKKGAACGSNADCPGSTCASVPGILAFELEGPIQNTPPVGACCTGGGVCTQDLEWVCIGAGSSFLGVGQACNQCSDDSPNVGANCTVNTDCSFCVGGVNDGLPCPANTCTGGACLGSCVPACSQGACCDTATGNCSITNGTCPGGTFQGFGSSCVPNCCDQPLSSYTGANNCEAAIVHNIILPSPGQEVVVTITGNNAAASALAHCVGGPTPGLLCDFDAQCGAGGVCTDDDSCFPPTTPGSELGWFEAFSIDGCAYMRIDNCCTDTNLGTPNIKDPKIPSYRILYDNCPCGQSIFVKRDPNNSPEPADARGAPYCAEDNAWGSFGPLSAGTYYYPILSFLGANFGKYQLHITAKACPEAACCHNICTSASGPACTTNADCLTVGEICINGTCQETCGKDSDCSAGQCNSACALLNILDCAAVGGAFLAPPNRGTAVTFCAGACSNGSCCTGPGLCSDEFVPGVLGMTIDNCDVLNGVYVGGFPCFGGTCGSGTRTGLSCQLDTQCPSCTVGNCCLGDVLSIAQPTPCPVCDISGSDNCQQFDDSVTIAPADLTLAGGARNADDFVPTGSTVSSVCAWGTYQKGDAAGNGVDCADEVADNFTVTIYNSDPSTGLPGTEVGSSTVTGANASKAAQSPSTFENLNQIRIWSHKLTLDTPIGGMTPGNQYWLEVGNKTDTPALQDPNCLWFWVGVDFVYDDYSASGAEPGYGVGSARTGDFAWCVDVGISPTTAPVRACCDCQGGCQNLTKRDCDNGNGAWHVDEDCATFTCTGGSPPSDNCTNVVAGPSIGAGVYIWDNHCTSTDGPNPIPDELGSASMASDVWMKFVSDCPANSDVAFGTCPSGTAGSGSVDTFIAVYHNNATENTCECPNAGNHTALLWPAGLANDEGCTGVLIGGGGVVATDITNPADNIEPGQCFMVRLGGFAGQGSEEGTGTVVIACIGGGNAPQPLTKSADDVCVGGGNAGATCSLNSDCASGNCRNKNRYISALVPATATNNAIRVRILTLSADSVLTPTNYTDPGAESERWLGAPTLNISDGAGFPVFDVAKIQCAFPGLVNWSAAVGADPLHIFGDVIVPGSTYAVANCASATNCSAEIIIGTAKFGDVIAPVNTVNFSDAFSVVATLQGAPTRPQKTRSDLVAAVLNPSNANAVNFSDVGACVSALQLVKFRQIVTAPPAVCP